MSVPNVAINQTELDYQAKNDAAKALTMRINRKEWIRKAALAAFAGGDFLLTQDDVAHLGEVYDWITDDNS